MGGRAVAHLVSNVFDCRLEDSAWPEHVTGFFVLTVLSEKSKRLKFSVFFFHFSDGIRKADDGRSFQFD